MTRETALDLIYQAILELRRSLIDPETPAEAMTCGQIIGQAAIVLGMVADDFREKADQLLERQDV